MAGVRQDSWGQPSAGAAARPDTPAFMAAHAGQTSQSPGQQEGAGRVLSLRSSTQSRPRRWEAGHVEMSSRGQREDGSDLGPDLKS